MINSTDFSVPKWGNRISGKALFRFLNTEPLFLFVYIQAPDEVMTSFGLLMPKASISHFHIGFCSVLHGKVSISRIDFSKELSISLKNSDGIIEHKNLRCSLSIAVDTLMQFIPLIRKFYNIMMKSAIILWWNTTVQFYCHKFSIWRLDPHQD